MGFECPIRSFAFQHFLFLMRFLLAISSSFCFRLVLFCALENAHFVILEKIGPFFFTIIL